MRLLSMRAVLVLVGVVLALFVGATWGNAQAVQRERDGVIVSGADIGVRIVGEKSGRLMGQLVVRRNGEWVDVTPDPTARLMPAAK
jgi:hypothetical protein